MIIHLHHQLKISNRMLMRVSKVYYFALSFDTGELDSTPDVDRVLTLVNYPFGTFRWDKNCINIINKTITN